MIVTTLTIVVIAAVLLIALIAGGSSGKQVDNLGDEIKADIFSLNSSMDSRFASKNDFILVAAELEQLNENITVIRKELLEAISASASQNEAVSEEDVAHITNEIQNAVTNVVDELVPNLKLRG